MTDYCARCKNPEVNGAHTLEDCVSMLADRVAFNSRIAENLHSRHEEDVGDLRQRIAEAKRE